MTASSEPLPTWRRDPGPRPDCERTFWRLTKMVQSVLWKIFRESNFYVSINKIKCIAGSGFTLHRTTNLTGNSAETKSLFGFKVQIRPEYRLRKPNFLVHLIQERSWTTKKQPTPLCTRSTPTTTTRLNFGREVWLGQDAQAVRKMDRWTSALQIDGDEVWIKD